MIVIGLILAAVLYSVLMTFILGKYIGGPVPELLVSDGKVQALARPVAPRLQFYWTLEPDRATKLGFAQSLQNGQSKISLLHGGKEC